MGDGHRSQGVRQFLVNGIPVEERKTAPPGYMFFVDRRVIVAKMSLWFDEWPARDALPTTDPDDDD